MSSPSKEGCWRPGLLVSLMQMITPSRTGKPSSGIIPLVARSRKGAPAAGPGNDWTNQSDQGSFHRKGIPFVYFGEEDHPDYHKPSDTPDRLMPGYYVGVLRTIADYITRFDAAPVPRSAHPAPAPTPPPSR